MVYLGSSLSRMWVLVYALQTMTNLTSFDVILPLDATTILANLKDMVEFEMLNPAKWIRFCGYPKFSFSKHFLGIEDHKTVLDDILLFVPWLLLSTFAVALLKLLSMVCLPFKSKLKAAHASANQQVYWNVFILISTLSQLQLWMSIV